MEFPTLLLYKELSGAPSDWPEILGARIQVEGSHKLRCSGKCLLVEQCRILATREDIAEQALRTNAIVLPQIWRAGRVALGWISSIGKRKLINSLLVLSDRRVLSILRNPYRMVTARLSTFGIADCCAALLGVQVNASIRLQAAAIELLGQYRDRGVIGVRRDALGALVAQRLCLDPGLVPPFESFGDSRQIRYEDSCVLLPSVARQWKRVCNALAWNQEQLLSQEAVSDPIEACLARRYSVIAGSAGSGKTAMLKHLASLARNRGWPVALTALTGKAASLLGPEGQTLHRYLGFGPGGFARETKCERLVIIDEASMLTLSVLDALLRAAPDARLVFAGDSRQLPPVNGIAVFRELCRRLPVIDLDRRREIVQRCPIAPSKRIACRTEHDALMVLSRWVARAIDAGVRWQVLAPVYDGQLGVVALNRHLQALCNPTGELVSAEFRCGDRVIVEENRYENMVCPVFNGQTGRIVGQADAQRVLVAFDHGPTIDVPPGLLRLAFCLSIHKAQGSRYQRVLVVWPVRRFPYLDADPELHQVATTRAVEETLVLAA